MSDSPLFIHDAWYFALCSRQVGKGKTVHVKMLNQPVLVGRNNDGKPFAMRDLCPHRGIPLSDGSFDGDRIQCCYHGWEFDTAGVCRNIPALTEHDKINVEKICTVSYPVKEANGNIWVFMPDPGKRRNIQPTPFPYEIDFVDDLIPIANLELPVNIDHANFGLLDPAHVTYVHRSWFWRPSPSRKMKEKAFEPHPPLGFKMAEHKPSSNSRAMQILGRDITTEIFFQLPGVRTELIRTEKGNFASMTVHTPVDENITTLSQFFYVPEGHFLRWLRPFFFVFSKPFLNQDYVNFCRQQKGLGYDPNLMLVGEVDRLGKWYFDLKKAYIDAEDKEALSLQINPTTLRWYT